ncbi:SDR family oxidoreductase [Stigmatella erecta]|uniref:Dihydroflavonol-4-reductase n=1 Tax=Stigmatella erecta TaxID=83460 RepID=A0A1I0JTQ5_9BACT|nr:SDR family oxidoreductase [Stigmatella erecta]SEU13838.1 dihydroflavonol-4-reductase [Stigmatella erecta]
MRTCFVTGGTGFVGRNLIEELVSDGWHVVALHRSTASTKSLSALGVEFRPGDVTDRESVLAALPSGVDAVFHVAASTSLWAGSHSAQYRTNVEGTRIVLEAALARKARRFIHTSSGAAWGLVDETITESTPSRAPDCPIHYCRTKWLAEQEVRKALAAGLDAVILNPSNVIGRYDYQGWSRMIRLIATGKLPGVPPGKGSFCGVRQVARAHITAVERGRTGENYLLAGTDASLLEMVSLIGKLLDKPVPRKPTPAWLLHLVGRTSDLVSRVTGQEPPMTADAATLVCASTLCSSEKAQRELSYQAISLQAMLEDCTRWLRDENLLFARLR